MIFYNLYVYIPVEKAVPFVGFFERGAYFKLTTEKIGSFRFKDLFARH